MSMKLYEEGDIQNLANMIREKNGTSDTYTIYEMDNAVEELNNFSGDYNDLTNKPTLGTASPKDVASSGDASATQVVMGNDSRLTDRRGSTWGQINGTLSNQTDLNNSINSLQGQIDTFTALTDGSTTGDAELTNIRVDSTGHTYPTAGDAVRAIDSQVNDMKTGFDGVVYSSPAAMVQGNDARLNPALTTAREINTVECMIDGYGLNSQTNKWNKAPAVCGIAIPVKGGDTIFIQSQPSAQAYYAVLTDIDNIYQVETPHYATGYTNLTSMTANSTRTITMPEDAGYIWFYYSTDSMATVICPVSIQVNGYEQMNSARDNIVNAGYATKYLDDNKIRDALKTTTYTADSVINYDGTVVSNQYTTGYKCTDYIELKYGDIVHIAFVRGMNLCGGALYDENQNFVKCIWGTDSWVQPTTDSNKDFQFIVDDKAVKYIRYNIVISNLYDPAKQFLWITPSVIPGGQKVFTVASTGGDFSTIKSCAEYIFNNNVKHATVYVNAGTYDLTSEFGSTFLDSYDGVDRYVGIGFGHYTHWIFAEGAKLVFNYTGSNVNVAEKFSPIVINGSCIIENMNLESTNSQYCVHDDWPERISNWIVKYVNCNMKHNTNTIGTYEGQICIGGGLLPNELVVVEGGSYECPDIYPYPISYHDIWGGVTGKFPAKMILKDIWTSGGFRFQDGPSDLTEVDVTVTNCSQGLANTGTHTHFTIKEWNNIIRS